MWTSIGSGLSWSSSARSIHPSAGTPPARHACVGRVVARVRAVHGVEELQRELGDLVVEARLPEIGQPASSSYEGEGYVIVRHPETKVVRDAVQRIVNRLQVELVEAE